MIRKSCFMLRTASITGENRRQYAAQAEASRGADTERWREISISTDVNARGALPALQF